MPTDHDHDDETLSDLPEPAVPDDVSRTVKGGATDPRVAAPTPPPPSVITPTHNIPRTIDPCW